MNIQKLSEDNISDKLSRDYEQEQEHLKAVVETLGQKVKQQKRVKIREIEIVYNFIGAFDFERARKQSQTAQDKKSAKVGAA